VRKTILLLVAGVGLFFAAAIAIVAVGTGTSEPGPRTPVPVERSPETPPAPLAPAASAAIGEPSPADDPMARSGPPIPVGWAEARVLQLPQDVVARELTPPLAPCLEGRPAPRRAPALTLLVEAIPGGLRVVDAIPAAAVDPSAAPIVECAQELLRDRKVSTGQLPPGERYRAAYALEGGTGAATSRSAAPSGGAGPARTFRRQRGKGTGGGSP